MPSHNDDPGQMCSKCFRLIIFLWVPFGMRTRKSSCNNFELCRKLFDLWLTPKGQFTNGGFDQTLWCSHPKGKGKDLILPANLSRPLGRKSDVQKEKIWSGAFWPSLKIILPIKLRFPLLLQVLNEALAPATTLWTGPRQQFQQFVECTRWNWLPSLGWLC